MTMQLSYKWITTQKFWWKAQKNLVGLMDFFFFLQIGLCAQLFP